MPQGGRVGKSARDLSQNGDRQTLLLVSIQAKARHPGRPQVSADDPTVPTLMRRNNYKCYFKQILCLSQHLYICFLLTGNTGWQIRGRVKRPTGPPHRLGLRRPRTLLHPRTPKQGSLSLGVYRPPPRQPGGAVIPT